MSQILWNKLQKLLRPPVTVTLVTRYFNLCVADFCEDPTTTNSPCNVLSAFFHECSATQAIFIDDWKAGTDCEDIPEACAAGIYILEFFIVIIWWFGFWSMNGNYTIYLYVFAIKVYWLLFLLSELYICYGPLTSVLLFRGPPTSVILFRGPPTSPYSIKRSSNYRHSI